MNTIQPKITYGTNNVRPNFGVRMKMNGAKELDLLGAQLSVGSSALGSFSSSAVGVSASQTVGSGLNTIGTAFSAKASGLNSSGIVPAVMGSATPHLTPATVASVEAHPSAIGSLFSTVGNWFRSFVKVTTKTKNPS